MLPFKERRWVWAAIATGFVAGAVVLGWLAAPREDSTMVSSRRQSATTGASGVDDNETAGRGRKGAYGTSPPRHLPLPSLDTPLGTSVPQLRRRAAEGDARAACRIAAEYEYCDALRSELAEARERIAGLDEIPSQARAANDVGDHLVAARASLATLQQDFTRHCGDAPALGAAHRARYWRQAAFAGHLPALRHYAIGNAFRFHDLLDALPELDRYRRDAELLATRAASRGDATMMYTLAMAYAEGSNDRYRPFLAQTIAPDPAKALAWFRRLDAIPGFRQVDHTHPLRRSVDRHLSTLSIIVSPQDLARAEAALGDNSEVVPSEPDELLAHAYPNGGLDSIDRAQCDRIEFLAEES